MDFGDYFKELEMALATIDREELRHAANQINARKEVLVAGNGGSCAISQHLACDIEKGIGKNIRVDSLMSNTAMITALANDCGYDQVILRQLEARTVEGHPPILILISSSGNSGNIIAAAAWAKFKRIPIIGFTGFDGGRLRELADISIHVNSNNYGIVEDCHQAAMHAIAQYIKSFDDIPF